MIHSLLKNCTEEQKQLSCGTWMMMKFGLKIPSQLHSQNIREKSSTFESQKEVPIDINLQGSLMRKKEMVSGSRSLSEMAEILDWRKSSTRLVEIIITKKHYF